MRKVILESPFAGNVEANKTYARACLRDCLKRGESPIASHLLLTQDGVLDDEIDAERELGLRAGHVWYGVAEAAVVYTDRGISPGMEEGVRAARRAGVPVEERSLSTGLGLIL